MKITDQELIDEYSNGVRITEISKKYGISRKNIYKRINQLRTPKPVKRIVVVKKIEDILEKQLAEHPEVVINAMCREFTDFHEYRNLATRLLASITHGSLQKLKQAFPDEFDRRAIDRIIEEQNETN